MVYSPSISVFQQAFLEKTLRGKPNRMTIDDRYKIQHQVKCKKMKPEMDKVEIIDICYGSSVRIFV